MKLLVVLQVETLVPLIALSNFILNPSSCTLVYMLEKMNQHHRLGTTQPLTLEPLLISWLNHFFDTQEM